MGMEPHIQVEHVSKSFGKKEVLTDVSLTVQGSEIYGLLGPSGAGKTTLVKMMAGIDLPSSGSIKVLGTVMPDLKMMGRIGFMAQADALYGELSAYENLDFFASVYGLAKKQRKERIEKVLELVNLTEDRKKIVNQFSGGMKRRLSLAAALLHEPDILILDEPTVGIDPVLRQSIWDELHLLSQKRTTIVVTTHVMDEAEKCDSLGMLRDGRLIATGTPHQLKEASSSSTLEEAFLFYGGANR